MYYYIKINQRVLGIIGKGEIDVIDGAILSYITNMCNSDNPGLYTVYEKGLKYTWVSYSHLISQMPMLKIHTTSPIQKRINKLIKFGFLKKIVREKTKVFISVLDKARLLNKSSLPKEFQSNCKGCIDRCEECKNFKDLKGYDDNEQEP